MSENLPEAARAAKLDPGRSGYLVGYTDHRVVYARELAGLAEPRIPVGSEVAVSEWPAGPTCEALLELALVAGEHSRFRLDPRIPEDRFVALYHRWMARSTSSSYQGFPDPWISFG